MVKTRKEIEMNSQKNKVLFGQEIERTKCRICLEEQVDVDWNEVIYGRSDLTYKDCYYKYTQMEYFDDHIFSQMLCRTCSNSLEFIDAFISKAIKSHKVLYEQLNVIIKEDVDDLQPEASFETVLVEETEITMYEDSNDKAIAVNEEQVTCSNQERCGTPITQTIKQENQNPETAKESENPTVQMVNDELADVKKNKKKPDISICCSICSKVMANKYKIRLHEETHIKNRERNETCVKCGIKFYSAGILKAHMLTHLENREKPHKCEFCDKAFFNKGGLKIHQRIHFGQMISCPLCTKEFFRQIDLDKHLASHSAARINSNIKTKTKCFFRCKDCGKTIRSASAKSHIAKHKNEPLFKCSLCDKEFFNRKSCVKHLKIHHKKTNKDIPQLIVSYTKNRMSHLFLQQNANIHIESEQDM